MQVVFFFLADAICHKVILGVSKTCAQTKFFVRFKWLPDKYIDCTIYHEHYQFEQLHLGLF